MERIPDLTHKMDKFIVVVIIINAISFGLETSQLFSEKYGIYLKWIDWTALAIFTIEIVSKIFLLRLNYFRDAWNIFDFIIVSLSYAALGKGITVLRCLRVLRLFLLITAVPRLRIIVRSLVVSLPGITALSILMSLIFYISAVIATQLFGEDFPNFFGNLGRSLFTLFQIMTLDSWAQPIVNPILKVHPYAWVFFIPFVLLSAFVIMNIFIAIIINGVTEARREELKKFLQEEREENIRLGKSLSEEAHFVEIMSHLEKLGNEYNQLVQKISSLENYNRN